MIQLNVGGVFFSTSIQTLEQNPGFFSALVADQQSADTITIDRDPTHFRHILNYLRGGITFPPTEMETEELIAEADFYSLTKLVGLLQNKLPYLKKNNLAYQLTIVSAKMN